MEDDPAPASLEANLEDLITASLGPMGRLLRRLHSFEASDQHLPEGLSANGIRLLKEGLQGLYGHLKDTPEADLDNPRFTPKWWIKEVRELAYDTEDFFDEVMQYGVDAGDGVAVGGSSLLSGIISKRKQRLPQTAQDFSHLMARLDDARERCQSFNFPPETAIKSDNGQKGISRHTPVPSLDLPVSAVSISDVHKGSAGSSLVGVKETMKKLGNLLAFGDDNQKQLKVIPIIGSAGVGKTTVARTIYHQYGGEFQCRAFVRVSRYPDMRRLLTHIISQIKAPWAHAFSDTQDLIDSIIKHLQGKRYFIVVDALWTPSVWDIISRAFPCDDCCSRILTTTQVEDVALACSGYETDYIFKMGPFNDGESRKLFFRYVFGSEGEGACPKEFKVVADRIISKCGGLPLSIVNIAGLLLPRMRSPAVEQWEKVESSLPSTLRTDPTSQGMKDVLILIYNELPLHLKTCLLYLSMYPEGYPIRKDDVMKQWVAESLVSDTEYDYFNELVRRGMIEPVDTKYDGEVLSCTVNYMVLDLIRHKSIEDNFIIAVNYFESTLRLPDKVRRLSVQFGGAKSAKIPESIRMSQVRSLLICGPSRCVPSIPDYGLLRVLILHIWADQDQMSFDFTRVAELSRLRYLMVECNSTVKLPDKIQGLQYLETLQLDGRLSAVPSDIGHLDNLRHLRLPSQANVRDLGGLTNLQDLHLTLSTAQAVDHLEDTMKYLGQILDKLSNLKSIILASAGSSPVNTSSVTISCDGLSNASPALAHLERLELLPRICIFPTLPKWFKTLGKLCSLKIAVRELSNSDTDIIKGLPALTALSLYIQTAPGEMVVFGKAGFSALKYFKLRCSEPLLKFEADAMPNLQKLRLVFSAQEVQQHAAAPICIEHLAGLKEISAKIGGAGAAGTESALRISVSNDSKNPKINGQMVDWNFYSDEDRITGGSEQAAVIVEKRDEILEEKTQYITGDGNREPYHRQISDGFTGTGSTTRVVKLHFVGVGRPKDPIYTGYPVQWQNGENIKVAIFENEKQILVGDLSKLQIEILPVHADFFTDRGREDFTKEKFKKHIYMYKGKELVLTTVNLTNGEAYLGPFSFTESSYMKKIRLIARVKRQDLAVRVQEAITDPFVVKDRRSEWLCKMGCWRNFGGLRSIKQAWAIKGDLLATKCGCAPPTRAETHLIPFDDETKYGKSHELKVLSLDRIKAATCNFSEYNLLGQSRSGHIYMGRLPDGEEVAVKRLSENSREGPNEFKNEVLLLSRLQHRNLLRLLAFCTKGEEMILVYEYMAHMSLDIFIFSNPEQRGLLDWTRRFDIIEDPEQRGLLDWTRRFDIIEGIARGLLYLHQDSRIRIIHRDLKARNILLDIDMKPKISGFGVARMLGWDESEVSTRVVGTIGYIAPESAMRGIFSVKSDIYSFGVLILEIITGKRATSFYSQEDALPVNAYAWQQWSEGKGEELIDPLIRPLCSIRQVLRCINIALLCVQDHAQDRPDIFQVILMLSSDMVSLPMPKPFTLMLPHVSSILSESENSDKISMEDTY